MTRPAYRTNIRENSFTAPINGVRQRMAEALVGQAVSLAVGPKKIAHGIVTSVLAEAGVPQIVVDGMRYNFNQVLTRVPAALSS